MKTRKQGTKAPDSICEPEEPRGPRQKKIGGGTLPQVWAPAFLDQADGRHGLVKAVRERIAEIEQDTGADSIQKRLLASRAGFLSAVLESVEVKMLESGEFRAALVATYTQMTNALLGLLRHLGLEKRTKEATLAEYIQRKDKKGKAGT